MNFLLTLKKYMQNLILVSGDLAAPRHLAFSWQSSSDVQVGIVVVVVVALIVVVVVVCLTVIS